MKIEEIKELSKYCLNCKTKPCQNGCPLGNDIPEFIKYVKEENYEQAYKTLTKTTVLSSICGRICPHMSQCMGKCVRGIKSNPVNIGELEAFVGDMAIECGFEMDGNKCEKNGKRVAVVGSGPAGLTCAAFLARSGVEVTIYEKYNELGGILRHGIPEFRLDRKILDDNIDKILNLDRVKVEYGKELGVNLSLEELSNQYDAVFIAIGANIPWKMGIKGEDLDGVFGGNELLENNSHPDYTGKKVAVIGGGNVAMDCARTINKMGAQKVTVIYRRAEEQMPAEKKEIEDAKNEGVEFLFQTNIIEIFGENKEGGDCKENKDNQENREKSEANKVKMIECIKTKLIQKEGETRLSPIDIPESNFELDIDYVVMAIGSMPEENVVCNLGLERDRKGYIKVDENYRTSMKNVFAGGDIVGAKATVAWAARTGRDVAKYLIGEF